MGLELCVRIRLAAEAGGYTEELERRSRRTETWEEMCGYFTSSRLTPNRAAVILTALYYLDTKGSGYSADYYKAIFQDNSTTWEPRVMVFSYFLTYPDETLSASVAAAMCRVVSRFIEVDPVLVPAFLVNYG